MLAKSKGLKTIKIKIRDERIEQVTKFQYFRVLLGENLLIMRQMLGAT